MPLTQQASTLQWGAAKTRVARAAGVAHDADWLLGAAEALKDALNTLELRRNWSWLLMSENINITSAASEYTISATARKPYTAVYNAERRLFYCPQRYFDDANPAASGDGPYFYNLYPTSDTGKIRLLPGTTGVVGTKVLQLKYLRAISILDAVLTGTASDSTVLDIPKQYEGVVLAWAKAALLADKGGGAAEMTFWQQKGNSMYLDAVRDEVDLPDADNRFVPSGLRSDGWNPNSLDTLLSEQYGL